MPNHTDEPRIAIVGATGAVGAVLRELLRDRPNVSYFASARSAGMELDGRIVQEANPASLGAGGFDIGLFAVGTAASKELVPPFVESGGVAIDKSAAFRMDPTVPLVVPEVNADRVYEHAGIVGEPNCSTIQLVCALKPLHDAAGLRRVRLATYQSVSGAGKRSIERLEAESALEHDLRMDWDFDGEEFDEEVKIREETRKILELPDLPVAATCVRVPVLVGHLEAVWIETETALAPDAARELLAAAPSVRLDDRPSPAKAVGLDDILVGRVRRDATVENGLSLLVAGDNLRKGAALNAVQIADLLLARQALAA